MDIEFDGDDEDDFPRMVPMNDEGALPPRVDACFRMLYFTLNVRENLREGLTKKETETYSSALECLKRYLDGEDVYEEPVKSLVEIAPTEEELRKIEEEEDG